MKLAEWIIGSDDGTGNIWLTDKYKNKHLYGDDLQSCSSEIRELDEFKNRDVVFINNGVERELFDDDTIIEIKNIECHIDDNRILNENFEFVPNGTIFIFGITYLPDKKSFNFRFFIFNKNAVRVKIFNNPHTIDLQIEVNKWLQRIGLNYTITDIKQSSSDNNGYIQHVISVWYKK